MSDHDRDPFALGGPLGVRAQAVSGDAQILTLFTRWLAAMRDVDAASKYGGGHLPSGQFGPTVKPAFVADADDGEERWNEAVARADKIELDIMAIPGGIIALAVKTVFVLRLQWTDWTPQAAMLRRPDDDEEVTFETSLLASMLRDASNALPEIAEIAAPVIHEDAALIDADIALTWCRVFLAEEPHWSEPPERRAQVRDQLSAAFKRIDELPAATARGREIKERVAEEATIFACLCRHDDRRLAEVNLPALRARVAAIVAEFDVPLPEGDAGIFEAARRNAEINRLFGLLSKDFDITCEIEAAEITPHHDRLSDALLDRLQQDGKPSTLAAAAVMLRHAFENGVAIQPGAGMVENVLALIEREGGGAAAPR